MYRMSCKLSDELGAKLDDTAAKFSMSKTAILSNALTQYFEVLDVQFAVMEKIKADPSILKNIAEACDIDVKK